MTGVLAAVVLVALVLVLARPVLAVARVARAGRAGARHVAPMIWAACRWRWLCSNTGLAYADKYRPRRFPAVLGAGTGVLVGGRESKVRYPRARWTPDGHGWRADARAVPGVGRAEFERAAPYLADAWRAYRVQVTCERPGRVTVRALRHDPLREPLAAPGGLFPALADAPAAPAAIRVFLGRDQHAADRYLPLAGVPGLVVTGLPGYGKTSLIASLLGQLAGYRAAQFALADLKDAGDYLPWHDRAFARAGDHLPSVAAMLEDVHKIMRDRMGRVVADLGVRNAWRAGPSPGWPLVVTVVDECHGCLDLELVKGDRDAERLVRTCRAMLMQLIKKGRSVLMLTVLITQKGTADSIPTALRDVCPVGLSFATRTRDASVAALGDQIRDYPGYDPSTLQDPGYVGVLAATLRTGADPFTLLRVPEVSEDAAAARAAATAAQCRYPVLPPLPVPVPVLS